MPSSYVIGKHYEKFIKDMIATGRYTNASEVIRDALRHFEESDAASSSAANSFGSSRGAGVCPGAQQLH